MTRKCRHKPCNRPLPPLKGSDYFERYGFCDIGCAGKYEREKTEAKRQNPAKPKAKAKAKKRPKSIAKLRNEVAELLQKLVRMKAADANGYCRCVTCDKAFHWKEMQGGHFIERGKSRTKLIEENIHPQCQGCNGFRMKYASTVLIYRNYMVEMYGEDFVKWLEAEAKKPCTMKRPDLEAMKTEVRARINELEQPLTKAG